MSDRVDLDVLRRERTEAAVPRPRRRLLLRVVPVLLVLAFLAVFFDSLREQLTDPIAVTVVRPAPATAASATEGEVLFQAAGWVEPDPFGVVVTALAPGVVDEMLVDEGDRVVEGDVVAHLVDDDAVIQLKRAEALVDRKRALLERRRAELEVAKASFEAALGVTEAVDAARGEVKRHEAHHQVNRAALAEKRAELRIAELELEVQGMLEEAGADGPWQKDLAVAKLEAARAAVERLAAEGVRAAGQIQSARAMLARAEGDLEHRFDERLRIRVAEAELAHERADAALAEQDLVSARLRLERMAVRAPVAGIVLERHAQPGSVVGDALEAAPLYTIYDPAALRVRVDVPQGQVARASRGQRAEIRADVRRGAPYAGEVIRIIDRADIQKVTLEVQVRVLEPDGLLKPEMLCQVTVFGSGGGESEGERHAAVVLVPRSCVVGGRVWVVDGSTRRSRARGVRTGAVRGDRIEVIEGLNLTDKVIVTGMDSLTDGTRVAVTEAPR